MLIMALNSSLLLPNHNAFSAWKNCSLQFESNVPVLERTEERWTEKTIVLVALEGEQDWPFVCFTFGLHLSVGCVLITREMGEYEVR